MAYTFRTLMHGQSDSESAPWMSVQGGFQSGEVVTLIARTGVGKSAISQNIIRNVLEHYSDSGVVFYSLEMPRLQAFERQLQIHAAKTRSQIISAYQQGDKATIGVGSFLSRFKDRFIIIGKTGISLEEIERRVKGLVALKQIKPVTLIVLDYLAYIGGGPKNAGVVDRTSELARGVKQLAKNLGAVVLLVAQTSRKAGDGSEEVTVTDARDSGAIEDSADFLLGCWRPELKTGISTEDFMDVHGDLWFRILKARRGLQDRFCVRFEGETLRVLEPEGGRGERAVRREQPKSGARGKGSYCHFERVRPNNAGMARASAPCRVQRYVGAHLENVDSLPG